METDKILAKVLDAMQEADEMGGPNGEDYIALMHKIAIIAIQRAETANHTIHQEYLNG